MIQKVKISGSKSATIPLNGGNPLTSHNLRVVRFIQKDEPSSLRKSSDKYTSDNKHEAHKTHRKEDADDTHKNIVQHFKNHVLTMYVYQ